MSSIPLAFLRQQVNQLANPNQSLGDTISYILSTSPQINTLLDCIPTTSAPVIHSPDPTRQSLTHEQVHDFITNFVLPNSTSNAPLGPNDRVMLVLPTGPENALALMALSSYHTVAPVNASCTAGELREDAERLRAKAIVTTRDASSRLELDLLREELDVDVIFVDGYTEGTCGLFEMSVMGPLDRRVRKPSRLHGLKDQSLVLHTSGTSGKKKVVPYSLNHLIVGTMAVALSWDLKDRDVNSTSVFDLTKSLLTIFQ
jgi:acyl-coenzyme A synthetase/AMP-(fatty) acid ligase